MLDENITNENQPKNKENQSSSDKQERLIPEPEKESFWKRYQEVIVTLVILIVIAFGFYFYAKKSKAPAEPAKETDQSVQDLKIEEIGDINGGEQTKKEEADKEKEAGQEATKENEQSKPAVEEKAPAEPEKKELSKTASSEKTENSFIEEAQAGDGITHLARRALKDYLAEKGGDSGLTNEHKIYIEDYLQNKIGTRGLKRGEKISFSFNLIEEGIASSKTLNQNQLKNLEKYSKLVFK